MYTRQGDTPVDPLQSPVPTFRRPDGTEIPTSDREFYTRLRQWLTDPAHSAAYSAYAEQNTEESNAELVIVNSPVIGEQTTDQAKAAAAVGQAWGAACHLNLSDESAVAVGTRLNQANCQAAAGRLANGGADFTSFCSSSEKTGRASGAAGSK